MTLAEVVPHRLDLVTCLASHVAIPTPYISDTKACDINGYSDMSDWNSSKLTTSIREGNKKEQSKIKVTRVQQQKKQKNVL